jgi:hypothetical protein
MKYKLLGILFVVLAIFAIPSFAYYWQVVEQASQYFQPVVDNDATADWKTYTNDQYGFEFKYPKGYYLSNFRESDDQITRLNNDLSYPDRNGDWLYFNTGVVPKSTRPDECTDLGGCSPGNKFDLERLAVGTTVGLAGQIVSFNNIKGFYRLYLDLRSGQYENVFKTFTDNIVYDESIYLILPLPQQIDSQKKAENDPRNQIFKQILSTFKFTDSNMSQSSSPVSDFLSCADAGYVVEFTRPETCKTPDGTVYTNTGTIGAPPLDNNHPEYLGPPVSNFQDCIKQSGSRIIETYPEQCVSPDGRTFPNPDQHL